MAPDTTPPSGATRYIQTSRGLLSYSQLAPLLAEQVLRVEREIASGTFAAQALSPELILDLHRQIAGGLCPDWAGRWRDAEVRVAKAVITYDKDLPGIADRQPHRRNRPRHRHRTAEIACSTPHSALHTAYFQHFSPALPFRL
jgi:hypothetical protein